MAGKRYLGVDVLTAAKQRINRVFSDFPRVYCSFSGGKDSGCLLELAANEARRRGRRLGVLFIDFEAQYQLTISYIDQMLSRHADVLDVYWVALPINLRNAVSQFEPQWTCWEPGREADWVRPFPSLRHRAVRDESFFPFFRRRMEFEEFIVDFGKWYSRQGDSGGEELTACLVGIRTQESLNRWRTIASTKKMTHDRHQWTTWMGGTLYNAYPVYDWATEDVWRFYGKTRTPYNRLYDRMHQAGLTIHQARICQPYGDDQRRGLWLYHVIEPETWARAVARVSGANFGAQHAGRTSGNVLGQLRVTKPDDITWQEFALRLLASMPPPAREQYENKIAVFLRWYQLRGYPDGIPDGEPGDANDKTFPSWVRIVKMLLKNDYHCKSLSFTPPTSGHDAYLKYRALMKKRRAEWQLI